MGDDEKKSVVEKDPFATVLRAYSSRTGESISELLRRHSSHGSIEEADEVSQTFWKKLSQQGHTLLDSQALKQDQKRSHR